MPTTVFQVYIPYTATDSGKVYAIPPGFSSVATLIYAKNYVYPITIRWDTSMFVAPQFPYSPQLVCEARIDNDYFFGTSPSNFYNMLLTDTAYAPAFSWGSQDHFPMSIVITKNNTPCPTSIEEYNGGSTLRIYPIPVINELTIEAKQTTNFITSISLLSIEGTIFMSKEFIKQNKLQLNLSNIKSGIYFLKIITSENQIVYEKILKF